jgi:hypothetical protein
MNKEKYNQIIGEAYEDFFNKTRGLDLHLAINKDIVVVEGPVYNAIPKLLSKEQFINKCKTNPEFSEKWGLKIEERELSEKERMNTLVQNEQRLIYEEVQSFKNVRKKKIKDCLDERNVPTKLITLTYNNETIESYE